MNILNLNWNVIIWKNNVIIGWDNNIIKWNNIIKNKEIKLKDCSFNSINNIWPIDVILLNDSKKSIIVESDSNLLDYIEILNINNTLTIKLKDDISISSNNWIKVYVSTNNTIDNITQIWSWDIIVKDAINKEELNVQVKWSWDITIEWNFYIKKIECLVQGSWDIDFSNNVTIDEADILLNWSGDIFLWNVKEASISINWSWDVTVSNDTNIISSNINWSWDISRI